MKMPKKGDVVKIEMLDHVQNDQEDQVLRVLVMGLVHLVDSDRIVLDWWIPLHESTYRKREHNDSLESLVIVRAAVTQIHRVVKWEKL